MNILLFSMPDSFEHMPTVAIRMPNGALTSLAGNIDPHHSVAIADLILVPKRVRETVSQLVRKINPDVVGLSVMTFQRKTALRIVKLIRSLKPDVHIVVGGYDASLAVDAYADLDSGVDFVVRGEGEFTFSSLLRADVKTPPAEKAPEKQADKVSERLTDRWERMASKVLERVSKESTEEQPPSPSR